VRFELVEVESTGRIIFFTSAQFREGVDDRSGMPDARFEVVHQTRHLGKGLIGDGLHRARPEAGHPFRRRRTVQVPDAESDVAGCQRSVPEQQLAFGPRAEVLELTNRGREQVETAGGDGMDTGIDGSAFLVGKGSAQQGRPPRISEGAVNLMFLSRLPGRRFEFLGEGVVGFRCGMSTVVEPARTTDHLPRLGVEFPSSLEGYTPNDDSPHPFMRHDDGGVVGGQSHESGSAGFVDVGAGHVEAAVSLRDRSDVRNSGGVLQHGDDLDDGASRRPESLDGALRDSAETRDCRRGALQHPLQRSERVAAGDGQVEKRLEVKGVAVRRRNETGSKPARRRDPRPLLQERADVVDSEPADGETDATLLIGNQQSHPFKERGFLGVCGDEDEQTVSKRASAGEPQGVGRALVQPLGVIDGDAGGPLSSVDQVEQGRPGNHRGHFRGDSAGEDRFEVALFLHLSEQLVEDTVRQFRLVLICDGGMGGPQRDRGSGRAKQGGLTEARLPFDQHEPRASCPHPGHRPGHSAKLPIPPDKGRAAGRHIGEQMGG
jgi:hypothetical protein